MGVDYSAKALIGVKIDRSILYGQPKTVRAYHHTHPLSMKFDPQTGAKLWKQVTEPHPEYDEARETFGGFPLINSGESGEGDECWVAVTVAGDTYSNGGDYSDFASIPPDLEERKQKLRALLEPLGAWSEVRFGLHAVLYCG